MDLEQLHRRLIDAARANPPSEAVPYAFEKRILAQLVASRPPDRWAVWSQTLWRAAAPCLLIALMLGAWVSLQPGDAGTDASLAADLEQAVYAPLDDWSTGW